MKRTAKDSEFSSRKISRRGLIMGGAQLAFVGALGLRMRYLQVDQADQFRMLAEENRINVRLLPPARGLMFDRNGALLAANEQNYKIVLVREDAGDVEEVLARLAQLVPLTAEDLERATREIYRRSPFVPVTVADRLRWEDISAVAVNAPALPGVTPEVGLSRGYPRGQDFAHVVGYVGPVSDYDLERLNDPDPLLQIPKFQIGKSGVEAKLEHELRGKAGHRRIEVNATGRVMRELDRIDGEPGANIQLSVDADLQNFIQARLAGESAAASVIDTETGDLLAIASSPSFDPNKFVRGISVADYSELTENKYRPLAGKAVQGTYPPGSTFKMVTALAALHDGVVSPEDTVYCPGYTYLGGRRFHCWKRGGHGNVNLHDSLMRSCDVYYYELAQRVGIEKISAMARLLGLGERHDLPMSAVAQGLAPTKDWKRERHGEGWQVGDTLNAAIGQGFVLASPLQLSIMAARLATGRTVTPRLVKSINGVEQPSHAGTPLGLNENLLRQVRRAMFDVSNSRRGTAFRSRIVEDAFRMAGKTGTSQVRSAVVRNQDVPWEQRDHALFVCFAPFDAPKIAVSVVVEHGGGGSKAAAPVARDIVLQALYGGLPPLAAYPAADHERIREMQRELPLRNPSSAEDGKDQA
ncbi:penicillin-binding protein 2 [Pseudohalocynthiibacter aestuariivivens]|jgi:penicillin-binding protein 2|uniref:Penicillin-binding protein 2 n=1 Tax=Pseudohalocynthiibacter aestuariivivens TaxID=1591409 RepID=A0ABV5JH38_9RHOB|nr:MULTISPECIES: penicillin-binding protein 2 [Pseudohalocynthiibacter]MBS9718472.1 penicillin-binding protein 2 [Pseudohalocynthiibacter aestuariivivens]MCK0104059.1 penicillin-binding protein 2 [Pseudohalocynthiibacter sp. F2068]